ASPVRDEAPLSSSAPELVTPPQAPAQAAAERPIVLALLPRDRAPGGLADDVPGGITTDLPAASARVGARQLPAPPPAHPLPGAPLRGGAAACRRQPPPRPACARGSGGSGVSPPAYPAGARRGGGAPRSRWSPRSPSRRGWPTRGAAAGTRRRPRRLPRRRP